MLKNLCFDVDLPVICSILYLERYGISVANTLFAGFLKFAPITIHHNLL